MKRDLEKEFYEINKDILNHEEYKKIKNYTHHGISRYDHCFRVSYLTYVVTKKLGLNYKEATRASLLHDFYTDEVEHLNGLFRLTKHPIAAVNNSRKYFSINSFQEDIIKTHMFPVTLVPPKYLESWIVDIIDDFCAIFERCFSIKKQVLKVGSFLIVFIANFIKMK